MIPAPPLELKLTRRACALMDALLFLAKGDPDADLWIPHKAGQELLDAGLVARTMHADGRVTYRLTDAGMRWRES